VAQILDRHTGDADAVLVRESFAESHHWTVERTALLNSAENDTPLPTSSGIIELFPRGGHWYIIYDDDRPLLNLGGSRALLTELEEALGDRFFHRTLDDPLYL
jgi:hypothetical protein